MKKTIITAGILIALVFALPGCRVKAQGLSGQKTDRFEAVSGSPRADGSGAAVARIPAAAGSGPYRNPAEVQGGEQIIATTFSSRRYVPITVQVGIPVKWTISMEQGSLNGCNGAMIIPKFNVRQRLKVGSTVVEFTPTETGNIAYSCWMGMIRSTITVVENLSAESSGSFRPTLYRPGQAMLRTAALEADEDDFSGFGGPGGCCGAGGFAFGEPGFEDPEGDDPYRTPEDFDDQGDALTQNGFGRGGCCSGGSRRL
ncbi:heavy metal transporter [Treponema primitia]|uniref:cupredoxin domain-containing protein n=1 Tax=Treponema primitia TaxID=88058 RepID=UPI00397E93D1